MNSDFNLIIMMMMAVMMTVCAVMMIAEEQNVKSFSQDVPRNAPFGGYQRHILTDQIKSLCKG